ncbi:hypothetical protein BGZ65_003472 [Modicella reniformis]|uniref:Uncharacterized protein n=1 Tax=Modicella reniformis TaxID=1440133 RepID=A0A9P6ILB9_9FUNG|nr:hypothetical protein BGZ65_003472 [Modicella reniformis]
MYKSPATSSLLPTAGASSSSSPTFRSGSVLGRILKSRIARIGFMTYVGFCALFTMKQVLMYPSKPETVTYPYYELERTYDPEQSYSVVSELSPNVILSKMFTFSNYDITDNIQPFFVRSESTPNADEITLTTFVLQDELSQLIRLVEHFPEPTQKVDNDDDSALLGLVPVLKYSQLPKDKTLLLRMVHEGQVVLSEKTWKKTIRNVDFNTWATQIGLSAIQNYDPYFGPSVIIRRDKMLWCPERFGNNQAACLFELYLSGADFWVLPKDFTINGGERKEVELTEREKTISTRLYQKFHEESCLKHARAFYAAGEWDSDRARHCRISCQKGNTKF